jgi:hypothetical protein
MKRVDSYCVLSILDIQLLLGKRLQCALSGNRECAAAFGVHASFAFYRPIRPLNYSLFRDVFPSENVAHSGHKSAKAFCKLQFVFPPA